MIDEDPKPERVAYTLEEAEAICASIDWSRAGLLSKEEEDAVVSVSMRYMIWEISRERCAEILKVEPSRLPPAWEHLKP